MKDTQDETDQTPPGGRQTLPMINEAHVAGRLTNSVTAKDYGEGKNRVQFSIAVPRPGSRKEGQPDADFITITGWGAIAKQCEGLKKGDGVEVTGRLRTWEDEAKRYHWGITANMLKVVVRARAARSGPKQEELAGV
ncbi:MAG: single-stranded DNA-binding protein [Elusimicrobia bacterium]|nr:single-stranded DNA-binding protein [Elusimicrobiota bacterium]